MERLQTLHAYDDSVLPTKGTSSINSLYSGAAVTATVFTNSLASSSDSDLFDNTGISVVESSVLAGESHRLSPSWWASQSGVYLKPNFVHDEILPTHDIGYSKTFPAFLESSYVDQKHATHSTIIPAVTNVADTTKDGVSKAGNKVSQGSLLTTSNKITGNSNLCLLSQCSQSFTDTSSNLQQSGQLTQYNIDNDSQDYDTHIKSIFETEIIDENTAIPFGNGNRTYLYMTGYLESFYTAAAISTSTTHDKYETHRVSPNENFQIPVNDSITPSQIDNPSNSEFESVTTTETSLEDDNNSNETTDIILPSYTPSASYLTYDVGIGSSYQAALSTSNFHPPPFCITSCNSEVLHTQGRDYGQSDFNQDVKLIISAEFTDVSNPCDSDMKTAIRSTISAFQDVSVTTIDSVSQTKHAESVSGYSDASPIVTDVTMTKVSESPPHLEPSSTKSYKFVFPTQSTDNVWSNRQAMGDVELETLGYKHVSSPILDVSSLSIIHTSADYHISETSSSLYPAQTVDITPTVAEDRSSTRLTAIFIPEDVTTAQWINTTEAASPKQMPTFNTTIIIASASAVLALVIVVIIALVCLKRKKDRSPTSKLQSDDLWVDLYRSNPAHHMPLPSLTSCLSAFEMSEAVNQGHSQDLKVESEQHVADRTILMHAGQEKAQKVSSFQIKKSNFEPDREFISLQPAIELEAAMELDPTEYWTNLFKSVSMTSLPTTELSYNTNITDYNFAAAGHKFRVVYAYKPVCKGEMGLKEGELIVCNERDRNGWMFGSKPKTNEEGWFPAVYVDEISNDDELYISSDVPETYDLLESNKLHSVDQYWTGIEHKVCDEYGSSIPGDLNLEPGETVIVLLTLANGWWFAVCGDSCGWFPGSYVQMTEVDNNVLEQPADSDITNKPDQQSCNNESSPEAKINKQEKHDKTNLENTHVLQEHQLENDQKSPTEENKTIPESNNGSLTQGSHSPQEVRNGDQLMESRYSPDTRATTYRSETGLEGKVQLSESYQTPSSSTNPVDNLLKSKESVDKDIRKRKSLRPARPAPPPPKQKPHKAPKDGTLNTGTNKASDINQPATPVLKKPVILVRGKRPKLHKVLRSRLDDKKLNPMIRPSTRGYISKPTINAENGWKNNHYDDYRRKAFNSHEHEQTNSSPSITDDFHGDLVTLLGQSNASPSHGFRPIAMNDQGSSSKASLESGSDDKSVSPSFVVNNDKGMKGKSKQRHSESPINNISTRNNLSPETKKEKSISPKLFTTSNFLHNVQRFHGALRQASPSPSSDWEKDLSAENGRSEQTGSNEHTFNLASRHQRAPTTVTPPKIPTFTSSSDHYSPSGNKQNGYGNASNLEINSDLDSTLAESENLAPMISLSSNLNNSDDYSDRKNIDRRPSRVLKPEISTPNRDSLRVTPGTVSEIVHHINSMSPQQQMSEDNETTGDEKTRERL